MWRILLVLVLCSHAWGYSNPVQGFRDSPDPGVVFDGSYFYAATTMGWDSHYFPIWRSNDLFSWAQEGWGLLQRPSWTACCDFWAPEIHIVGFFYNLYYTARDPTGHLCIGVAQSDRPTGPYTDKGTYLLRNDTEGVIDATVFQENSKIYLIYKTDGNAHGKPTEIYATELTPDGMSVKGGQNFLLRDSLAWEHGIVEAPWVVHENQMYYLFYSSCGYADKCYSVGVARSSSLLGPYEKYPTPILHTASPQTANSWEGPGHCSVLKNRNGKYAIVYHAWPHAQIGSKRVMLTDQLQWVGGWPVVNSGSPSESLMPDF